jgi:hypothetical protein
LEKLIGIKEAKGEKDLVTVHARARTTNWRWRKLVDGSRNLERTRLQNLIRRRRKDSEEVAEARAKLAELDREAKEIAAMRAVKKRKRGRRHSEGEGEIGSAGPRSGRPRKIRRTNAKSTSGRVNDLFGTTTPDWDSTAAEEEEEIENEVEISDGESEEDQLAYDEDEDAPGEMDDTHMYDGFG